MEYVVIEAFVDLQNDNHRYSVGDKFPHADIEVSDKRINDLLSGNNKRRTPLIKEAEDKAIKPVKPVPAVEPAETVESTDAEPIIDDADVEKMIAETEAKTARKSSKKK